MKNIYLPPLLTCLPKKTSGVLSLAIAIIITDAYQIPENGDNDVDQLQASIIDDYSEVLQYHLHCIIIYTFHFKCRH